MRETSHSFFYCAGSQVFSSQVETDIKENLDLQEGGKAFGLLCGLNCGETFFLCGVRDYRMIRSTIMDDEKSTRSHFKVMS